MRALSLRARFILVVVLGAILPLAVVGVWLTRSAARAGEDLLQSSLDASATAIAAAIRERWQLSEGDLMLLARNDVARRALSPDAREMLTADDSSYLASLAADVRPAFTAVVYRDTHGTPRWRSEPNGGSARIDGATFGIARNVADDAGRKLGSVEVRALVGALVPADSLTIGIVGARIVVMDAETKVPLLVKPSTPEALARDDTAAWLHASARIAAPPLEVVMSASPTPFVKPFQRSARLGLAVLMIVVLATLLVCTALIARAGRALRGLADAVDAVAAGDLTRVVEWKDADEVGRVAGAFNRMTESLRRTLEQLAERRALAAVGEFAASLSHEVRNSLTAVRVDLQHAERRAGGDTKEGALIARALSNVRRLDSAVTGSLRAARGHSLERTVLDLRDVLATAVAEARPVFGAGSADLKFTRATSAAVVHGNGAALEQLFLNLLLNAGEAVPAGGHADVLLSEADGRAVVSIADSGPGMPAGALSRLEQGLFTSKREGTGLGVRIARRIAIAHGGDIAFESHAGVGTTVRVSLPLAAADC